ncbi:MAG: SpoIIE family protein phosphatase [Treponema sp.]|jgi:sigma-B regulation protein RsbU (phosphoserine phosphatase)|nr:SpoIIE family protein phosphatase [Treponema sp.]
MKIKQRVLIQTLSASLVFTLFLSVMFFVSIAKIRKTARINFGELGNSAAAISAYALEEQVIDKITRIASDTAIILDEKFSKIENHTRSTADIAASIYTRREAWRPNPLRYVQPGQIAPPEPYLHAAPGVDLSRIKAETDLAGNIAEELRQITVVDRGITTSAIGGESGYIIAMDAFPWPSEDFEHRSYEWYQGAKESGGLYWTGVYVDPRGRGPAVSCAIPFYDQSGGIPVFRGVARNTVMLSDFSKIINSARIGRTGYLFLVDKNGLKLFSSGSVDVRVTHDGRIEGENYLAGGNSAIRSLGSSMTLGASGMAALEMNGVPVYAAYAPIHTLGWSLGVVIPVREISSPAWLIGDQIGKLTGAARNAMDRHILLMTGITGVTLLLSLCVITLLALRFTGMISRPILALTEGVQEVSGGNLNREVAVKTGDELEQLANTFNIMTSRLRDHIAEIELVTAERQRINTELDVATRIQTSMLPSDFPPYAGRKNEFDLFAAVHPAREVGGDFYDFFFIDDDHFACLVADVSGKGIPAALFMAIAKTLIKNRLQTGEAMDLAMGNVNRQLCGNNIAGMFVTVWLAVLEIATGRLDYVNAGHNPPLLANKGNNFAFLVSPPDLVLAGMDCTVYHRREIYLKDGDTLFFYTDGITEAANDKGDFYGKERLCAFLNRHGSMPLRELLPQLRAEVSNYSAGVEQSDDITMMALRISREQPFRSLTVEADLAKLPDVIAFIGAELDRAGAMFNAPCPEKVCGQIELAAEEIFVNIVRYAYRNPHTVSSPLTAEHGPPAAPETMLRTAAPGELCEAVIESEVSAVEGGAALRLVFIDSGMPFNPLEHSDPDINLPLERRDLGGLGVLIVKRTMDTIQYSHTAGKNHLTVTKTWNAKERP